MMTDAELDHATRTEELETYNLFSTPAKFAADPLPAADHRGAAADPAFDDAPHRDGKAAVQPDDGPRVPQHEVAALFSHWADGAGKATQIPTELLKPIGAQHSVVHFDEIAHHFANWADGEIKDDPTKAALKDQAPAKEPQHGAPAQAALKDQAPAKESQHGVPAKAALKDQTPAKEPQHGAPAKQVKGAATQDASLKHHPPAKDALKDQKDQPAKDALKDAGSTPAKDALKDAGGTPAKDALRSEPAKDKSDRPQALHPAKGASPAPARPNTQGPAAPLKDQTPAKDALPGPHEAKSAAPAPKTSALDKALASGPPQSAATAPDEQQHKHDAKQLLGEGEYADLTDTQGAHQDLKAHADAKVKDLGDKGHAELEKDQQQQQRQLVEEGAGIERELHAPQGKAKAPGGHGDRVDQLASQHKQAATHKTQQQQQQVEQSGKQAQDQLKDKADALDQKQKAKGKQLDGNLEGKEPKGGAVKYPKGGEVKPLTNINDLKKRLETEGKKDLAKLEEQQGHAKEDLHKKFDTQRKKLETEHTAQLKTLAKHVEEQSKTFEKSIAKKKEALDKQIEAQFKTPAAHIKEEKKKLTDQAAVDAPKVEAEAKTQAAEVFKSGEAEADNALKAAKTESSAAKDTGLTQAKAATDAAEGRASSLDIAGKRTEAKSVRDQGTTRAGQAVQQALAKADLIEKKGEALAKSTRDKAKTESERILKSGTDQARKLKEDAAGRAKDLDAKLDQLHKDMEQKAKDGVAAMEKERTDFKDKSEKKAKDDLEKVFKEGMAKIDAQEKEGEAKLQQEHDRAEKQARARIEEAQQKLEKGDEKHVKELERMVNQTLQKVQAEVKESEKKLKQEVAKAEGKVKGEVARQVQALRTQERKTLAEIDKYAADTRKRIEVLGKETVKQVAETGKQGEKDLDEAAKKAQADQLKAGADAVELVKKDGGDTVKGLKDDVQKGTKAMADLHKDLAADINKQWVDDAVKAAHKDLNADWWVSDDDAAHAMNTLNSLPKEAQGQAIGKMDPKDFNKLLDEVPKVRREEFKSLVDATTDPDKKLKLWGEYQKSKVANDAAADNAKEDTGHWWSRTDAQKAAAARVSKRESIVDTTDAEVDEETQHLLDEAKKSGKPLDMNDVDALMERRTLQSDIEREYAVNITSSQAGDGRGRAVWSKGELEEMRTALARLPKRDVYDNPLLKEIQRVERKSDKYPDGTDKPDDELDPVADHLNGKIRFYGRTQGDQAGVKHHRMGDQGVNVIAGTLTHEIGHDMADGQNKKQFEEIRAQADWQNHATRPDPPDPGRVVMKNPYGAGFVSYKKGAIPETADAGTWEYARSNPDDHFAELYTKMVNAPAETRRDMIDKPLAVVASEEAKVSALSAAGRKAGDPDYDAAVKQRDDAKDNAERMKNQYDIMHDQVLAP